VLASPLREAKTLRQVRKLGLTPNFFHSLDLALTNHEILKLRLANLQDERKELSTKICAQTGAIQVSMVGHTAVYYRPSPDPEKRKLVLPRAKSAEPDGRV